MRCSISVVEVKIEDFNLLSIKVILQGTLPYCLMSNTLNLFRLNQIGLLIYVSHLITKHKILIIAVCILNG